jgi:hypothetical protein
MSRRRKGRLKDALRGVLDLLRGVLEPSLAERDKWDDPSTSDQAT